MKRQSQIPYRMIVAYFRTTYWEFKLGITLYFQSKLLLYLYWCWYILVLGTIMEIAAPKV